MANYLRLRDQHYYLRIRVPADLLGLIPSPEILKSLHTRDHKTACLSASAMRPKFLQVFTLIRAGFITQEHGRLNRKHVADDPLKTFHSLRHSFADTLKQLGVQENLISELMGHANSSKGVVG